MKSSKKTLLIIVTLAIFTFSYFALGAKKNVATNEAPSKSKEVLVSVHVLDPPPALIVAPKDVEM